MLDFLASDDRYLLGLLLIPLSIMLGKARARYDRMIWSETSDISEDRLPMNVPPWVAEWWRHRHLMDIIVSQPVARTPLVLGDDGSLVKLEVCEFSLVPFPSTAGAFVARSPRDPEEGACPDRASVPAAVRGRFPGRAWLGLALLASSLTWFLHRVGFPPLWWNP